MNTTHEPITTLSGATARSLYVRYMSQAVAEDAYNAACFEIDWDDLDTAADLEANERCELAAERALEAAQGFAAETFDEVMAASDNPGRTAITLAFSIVAGLLHEIQPDDELPFVGPIDTPVGQAAALDWIEEWLTANVAPPNAPCNRVPPAA